MVLPKFKFDSSINLNDVVRRVKIFVIPDTVHLLIILILEQLGIQDIFETNATFPLLARGGKTEGRLKVSNIIQKSGIVVDEKGEKSE